MRTISIDAKLIYIIFAGIICNMIFDIYIAMIPQIVNDLHSNLKFIQSTLSIEYSGFALGAIIVGILQNKHDLIRLMLFGILMIIISSICCSFATSMYLLYGARIIQGIGDGFVFTIIGVLIVRLFPEEQIAKVYSICGLFLTTVPAITPFIGSLIAQIFGSWRSVFYLLASLFTILYIYSLYIKSQLKACEPKDLRSLTWGQSLVNYLRPMRYLNFTFSIMIAGIALGSYVSLLSLSPYYFQHILGLSETAYGSITALTLVPMLLSGSLQLKLIKKFKPVTLVYFSLGGIALAIIILIIMSFMKPSLAITSTFLIFIFFNVLIQRNCFPIAMKFIPAKDKENAAAVQTFIYLLFASLAGQISSYFIANTIWVFIGLLTSVATINLLLISKVSTALRTFDQA